MAPAGDHDDLVMAVALGLWWSRPRVLMWARSISGCWLSSEPLRNSAGLLGASVSRRRDLALRVPFLSGRWAQTASEADPFLDSTRSLIQGHLPHSPK